MSKRLESYLSDVASYLGALPPAVRDSELREISGHLEQLVADLRAAGEDEAAALTLALKRFGSARSVGLRLRDVWEGNRSLLVVALAVFGSNWGLQIVFAIAAMGFALMPATASSIANVALRPSLGVLLCASACGLPLGWNFLLGQWGGRRVAILSPFAYGLLLFVPMTITVLRTGTEVRSPWGPPWLGLIFMTIALLGAWCGSERRRHHRMALVSGPSLEEAAKLLAKPLRLRERAVTIASWGLGVSLLCLGLGLWAKLRLDAMKHPSTPEAAVRVLLAAPSDEATEMEPSTDIKLRVLPPTAPAERAGRACRVAYAATMHATPAYRARRVAWMNRELQAEREGRYHDYSATMAQAAIKRMKPAGYRTHGILRVVKTPQGWQPDTSGGAKNQPWAWLYLIGYENQPGVQP